jgi:hypothetical protein
MCLEACLRSPNFFAKVLFKEESMFSNTEDEQGALKLAEIIEDAVNNPEQTVKRIGQKSGVRGVLGTIIDFIKDYKNKGDLTSEEWAKQQFVNAGIDNDTAAKSARDINQGIKSYENAKKSLLIHLELGGTRESWLAQQIEIGAAINKKDTAEYAREIAEGLNDARNENAEFLFDITGQTKEAN